MASTSVFEELVKMATDQEQPSNVATRPDEGPHVSTNEWEKTLRRIVKSEIRKALPSAVERATRGWDSDPEIVGLIRLLAARSNDAKDEVLRKALTLYGLALDAREKGNKVVIVDSEDCIVHDVIGFESMLDALNSGKG